MDRHGGKKKSKSLWNDEVNDSFAQLCLQQPNHVRQTEDECSESTQGNIIQETVVEEAHIVVVRRRFIHVKRLARMTMEHRQLSIPNSDANIVTEGEGHESLTEAGVAGDNLPHPC